MYLLFEHIVSDTWDSNGPFFALQRCTGKRGFTHAGHVHCSDLKLVKDSLLQVLRLKDTNVDSQRIKSSCKQQFNDVKLPASYIKCSDNTMNCGWY